MNVLNISLIEYYKTVDALKNLSKADLHKIYTEFAEELEWGKRMKELRKSDSWHCIAVGKMSSNAIVNNK